jgi:hypothetical protein
MKESGEQMGLGMVGSMSSGLAKALGSSRAASKARTSSGSPSIGVGGGGNGATRLLRGQGPQMRMAGVIVGRM